MPPKKVKKIRHTQTPYFFQWTLNDQDLSRKGKLPI